MNSLTFYEKNKLQNPIMVVALRGTFDFAKIATSTLEHIQKRRMAKDVAMIDPEIFYNFQKSRPTTSVSPEGARTITWPGIDFSVSTYGSRDDLILVLGDEPHTNWEQFASHILEVAQTFNCSLLLSVGSVAGTIPHTRTFPITKYSVNKELAEAYDLKTPSYEGPTGFMAALNKKFDVSDIPCISFNVEAPHYLPSPPNPKAIQTLLQTLEGILSIGDLSEDLTSNVEQWCDLVDKAVASDSGSASYLQQLEEQYDNEDTLLEAGKDLVIELETFLKNRSPAEDVEEPPEEL